MGPKSNTNPLDKDGDDKDEESESFETGVRGFWGFGFEFDSKVEFWRVTLLVLVSGFVEQQVRERRVLFLEIGFEA